MTAFRPSRRRVVRALAFVVAGVVALGAGVVIDADRPVRAAETVTGGTVDWGVRAAFRNYVVGPIAKGDVATSGGAAVNSDGTYRFPVSSGTVDGIASVDVATTGTVRFAGHQHHGEGGEPLLQLAISNIRVQLAGSTGTLTADVVSLPLEGDITNPTEGAAPVSYPGVQLATLNFGAVTPVSGDGTVTFPAVPATLTAAGAPAFSGFYAPGEALDPVTITVQAAGAAPGTTAPPAGGTPTTAPPSGTTPTGPQALVDRTTVAPGGTVTASGSGFTAGEQVQLWLHSDPVFLAVATAGADGTASVTGTIPADVSAGQHRLELRGLSSGTSLFSAPVTVGADIAALPHTGPSPRDAIAVVGMALLAVGVGLLATSGAQKRLLRP